MGGRGTFASGNPVPYTYRTVGRIEGIKVLEHITGGRKLPEEAHSSAAYALLNENGTLRVLRFYDSDHNLRLEIANHPEGKLAKRAGLPRDQQILHYHTYDKDFVRTDADFLTKAMRKRLARLFNRRWR